jgi:heme-degrading monooxygenase HmoA
MQEEAGFVVVDIWKVKPGKHSEVEKVLGEAGSMFRKIDGVLSVDYTLLVDDPDRYLVVFRYRDADTRKQFVATEALTSTMSRLRELWDLESPIYQGVATGL